MGLGIEVLLAFSPLPGGVMGMYKRENCIYYLQVFYEKRNRRISLETKNKGFAQEMHDSFLRSKVYQKLSKFHKTPDEKSASQDTEIKLLPVYHQYLEHCSLQNVTEATLVKSIQAQ